MVAAAGNKGNTSVYYPAAYDSVIGVGAVDRDGNWYYHSNHNGSVFLTAPGVEVKTAGQRGGYVIKTGTSFSTPFVTAAAAVVLSIDDSLTPAELRQVLSETASDQGGEGWDEYYGYGILDITGCVTALAGDPDAPCAFSGAATLRNYTDTDLDCAYVLAEYDEAGRCLNIQIWEYTVPAHGSVKIAPPEEHTIYGQFVYETATLTPLANARKSLWIINIF